MKKFYLAPFALIVSLAMISNLAFAQCGPCTPDESLLTPASNYPEGALAPEPAPPVVQGFVYDEVITYVMPATYDAGPPVGVINVDQVIVSTIAGLPSGIVWNCGSPDCTYYPQQYQYGCVHFCGTTYVSPGIYDIEVTVLGTALGVTQPSTFSTQIEVLPATGGNNGFSFAPISGCDSVTSAFEGLIDGSPNPTTYDWIFSNGNTSSDQIPVDQTFNMPGDNEVTLVTTIWDYVLESVTATTVSNQWCGDIEEIDLFGQCQGAPDMVWDLSNGSGAIISSGSEVTNNTTATWSDIGLVIAPGDGPFSFQFQDVDALSQWDDLGGPSFNITDAGTFSSTGDHVSVSYTIGLVAQTVLTNVDTVVVNTSPSDAVVGNNGTDSFCVGDSTELTVSGTSGLDVQWFSGGLEIPGANGTSLWVDSTGTYSVTIVDPNTACGAGSNNYSIAVEGFPPIPVISYNAAMGYLEVTNGSSFDVQWFLDGIAIPGAMGETFADVTTSGPYTVELSSSIGCSQISFPYTLCIPGAVQPLNNDTVCCGDQLTLVAEGFTTNNTSTVVWGMSSEADGPILSQADADAAVADNSIFTSNTDTLLWSRNCATLEDSLATGSFYFTPFTAQNPDQEPLLWDTLNADCRPNGLMCPVLMGADSTWEIFPMIFTFPDGSTLNVNDELAFGLPLSQPLLDLAGGLPCLNLTDLFAGDPNGLWSITLTNTGPVGIDMGVPDFLVVNFADSCSLISEDQIYTIPGIDLFVAPGASAEAQFWVPPLPGGFPTIEEDCAAFGTPQLVHFVDCYPELTNTLEVSCFATDNTNEWTPTGYIDITADGGTPPYTFQWDDGSTQEDRPQLGPGTYTVVVTDGNGFTSTTTCTVGGVPLGIEDLVEFGFNLEQNIPNPANGTTIVPFVSETPNEYFFVITTVDGRTVLEQKIQAQSGLNRLEVALHNLSAGVYYYSLSNGINRMTKRMMVLGNQK